MRWMKWDGVKMELKHRQCLKFIPKPPPPSPPELSGGIDTPQLISDFFFRGTRQGRKTVTVGSDRDSNGNETRDSDKDRDWDRPQETRSATTRMSRDADSRQPRMLLL